MIVPQISIIVPIYNVDQYLSRCLDSILVQTFRDFELLLIDDGSLDKSGEICDEYAIKDSRVKVFHVENNGVSSARNVGLENANGRWIAFIDGDDWIGCEYLNQLYIEVMECHADMILQSPIYVYNNSTNSRKIERKIYSLSEGIRTFILDGFLCFTEPHSKLFRTKKIQNHNIRFKEGIKIGEDIIFISEFLRYTSKVMTSKEVGYYYVVASPVSSQRKFYSAFYEFNSVKGIKIALCSLAAQYHINIKERVFSMILFTIIRRYLYAISLNKNYTLKQKIDYIYQLENDSFYSFGCNCNLSIKSRFLRFLVNHRLVLLIILLIMRIK